MRIGIIGAMSEEVTILNSLVQNPQTHDVGNHKYVSGTLGNYEVVITESGIGKVCAARATSTLILHFKVDCVINTGCAGGIGANLQIGDIVLSTGMAYHDFDVTQFGKLRGQVPGYQQIFPADEYLVEKFISVAKQLQTKEDFTPNIFTGIVLTGDQFIADKEKCLSMLKDFPEAQVTEMEGAAVAHVCSDFEIPCIVIRSVSDTAKGDGPDLFEKFVQVASDNSAKLLATFLNS